MAINSYFIYEEKDTFWHRMNVGIKILLVLISIISIWLNLKILLFTLILFTFILITGASLSRFISIIKSMLPFLVIIFLLNSYFYSALYTDEMYILYPYLTYYGVYLAGITVLRLLVMILVLDFFFITTSPEDLEDFLLKIRLPHSIVLAITLMFNFIPTIYEEISRIKDAQMMRGIYNLSFLKRLKLQVYSIVLPMILSALNRAGRIAEALELSGAPSAERVILTYKGIKLSDVLITIFIILIIISLAFFNQIMQLITCLYYYISAML
ncbi:MAG: energy-coupling factor transporter transmembrane component T family protein [Candidatus Njordarchaeales archaeon]